MVSLDADWAHHPQLPALRRRVEDDQRHQGEDRFITIGFLDGTMGHPRLDAV